MRKHVLLLAALAAALVTAGVAAAKGPSGASVSGPGLAHAIVIEGYGEGGNSTPLGILVAEGGFFSQVFEQTPKLTLQARPKGWLGPRYEVTYTVPGGNNAASTLRQDLYPYATNGPVTFMKPGQKFWETNSTVGGWYRGTSQLKRALVKAGLPARAPTRRTSRDHTIGVAIGAGAGVAVAAGVLALLYRRRSTSD
jgi:hypothetical protein